MECLRKKCEDIIGRVSISNREGGLPEGYDKLSGVLEEGTKKEGEEEEEGIAKMNDIVESTSKEDVRERVDDC